MGRVDGAAIAEELRRIVPPKFSELVDAIAMTTSDGEYAVLALALIRALNRAKMASCEGRCGLTALPVENPV
jgi:hypothetical protein